MHIFIHVPVHTAHAQSGRGEGALGQSSPLPPLQTQITVGRSLLEKFSGSGHAAGAFDTFEILLIFLSQ